MSSKTAEGAGRVIDIAPAPARLCAVLEKSDVEAERDDDAHNPLWSRTARPSCYNWIQIVFPGVVLIPLRIIVTLLCFVTNYLLASAVVAFSRDTLGSQGLTPASWVLLNGLRCSVRVNLFVLGMYWIRVEGAYAGRDAAPILVANHVTWCDYMVLASHTFGYPISRVENLAMPIVGQISHATQAIVVDRTDPESRQNVVQQIIARAADPERWPHPVIIFPEGTCTSQCSLIQFQQGAFTAKVPVQPVALEYGHANHDLSWAFGATLWTWLVMLSQWVIPVRITFCSVVQPAADTGDRTAIVAAEEARSRIGAKLCQPETEYTLADMRFQRAARSRFGVRNTRRFAIETGLLRTRHRDMSEPMLQALLHVYCRLTTRKGDGKSKRPRFTPARWVRAAGLSKEAERTLCHSLRVYAPSKGLTFRELAWRTARVVSAGQNGTAEQQHNAGRALLGPDVCATLLSLEDAPPPPAHTASAAAVVPAADGGDAPPLSLSPSLCLLRIRGASVLPNENAS
eukprot:Rhum_TRINITY_DN161_c0_g1::Rhum_TRINITY_DN161_c0_g1_i1::g.463::m.463/K13510/LPCAT1_2; lysophosphatidylcholine acyltransferase / lyso-PAF acetyltransferase